MAANQVPRVQDANHALIYMQAVTTIMVSLGYLSKTTSYSRFLLDTSMKYASAIMLRLVVNLQVQMFQYLSRPVLYQPLWHWPVQVIFLHPFKCLSTWFCHNSKCLWPHFPPKHIFLQLCFFWLRSYALVLSCWCLTYWEARYFLRMTRCLIDWLVQKILVGRWFKQYTYWKY